MLALLSAALSGRKSGHRYGRTAAWLVGGVAALTFAGAALQSPPTAPPAPSPASGHDRTSASTAPAAQDRPLTAADLDAALRTVGLQATPDELRQMLGSVTAHRATFERNRERPPANGDRPALRFVPLGDRSRLDDAPRQRFTATTPTERPADLEQLAFAPIAELSALIRSRRISCVELTDLFLDRLTRLDPQLHAVVHLLPQRARERARQLDELLDAGTWLGPLHGIPYGAKDLLSARGAPTTWGAAPYRTQVIDADAAVVTTLRDAGAVLVAKLSLGALAWGDVWYGGRTRNPWQPQRGSSGSSAGPAAATAAGMVPFAIGSETLGSIVSPSVRCGATGLRPTFGLVARDGAMALSWSMDKLGPICRSAADAALVFDALLDGPEPPRDGASSHRGFASEAPRLPKRVGALTGAFRAGDPFLAELSQLGCELVPFELPRRAEHARDLTFLLDCEAAAAFDELTRSGRDDLLVRQVERAWPNVFRAARLVPAVEYIQAQRLRHKLMSDLEAAFDATGVDVVVHPPFAGAVLAATNLTGSPTLVAPRGMAEDGRPDAVCFTGRNYADAEVLHLAQAWQRRFPHHRAARPAVR